MLSLLEQTQVLYEIAMDVGGSMHLQVMLKRSIQTVLHKLNGQGAVVLADRRDGERCWLEEVFAMPRNIRRNPAYASAIRDLPTSDAPGTGRTHWPDPQAYPAGNVYYYHFDLAGFGVLVLLKARPLDPALARSLRSICDRLAESCIACETAKTLAESRENLRASEERYRDLYENAPHAYFSVGIDGRIHGCNRRAGELLEYTVEELVGRPALDLYADTPHGKEKATKVLERFRAGETVRDEELQMQKADGTPVWISLTLNAVRDAQGRVVESRSLIVDISERKQVEEALRESEERYRSLVEHTSDAVFCYEYDPPIPTSLPVEEQVPRLYAGQLAECNVVAARYYGSERVEDVLGKKLTELFGAAPGGPVDEMFLAFIHDDYRIVEGEGVEELPDGSKRYFSNNAHGVVVDDKLVRVWGAYRDITERKQAEEALRESEEKYRLTSENIPVVVYSALPDEHSTSTFLSGRARELTGYSVKEFLEEPGLWNFVVQPEDRAFVWERINDHRRNKTTLDVEYRIITKDGVTKWIRDKAKPALDENGEIVRIDGFMEDITERKRAEEALRESEERYRSFLQNFRGIAFRGRMDFTPTFFHGAVKEITGYTEREFLDGKPRWDQIIHPEDLPALFTEAEERMHSIPHYSYEREYRIVRKDGAVWWVHEIIQNVCDDSGEPAMVQGAIYDITERKRAEEELQQRAAQLALLNEIGRRVAALLGLDEVLDRAAQLVQARFGFHHVGLFTRAAGEDRLVMRARAGEFASLFPPDHSVALGQGMVGWVGLHGETLLANDVDVEPRYVNLYPDRLPTRSELSVPIRIGDKIVGVLDLQSPQPDAFDPSDVTTLETLAGQMAVAIHNARLFETERAAREQAEKLQAATQALSTTLDLQQVFERILSELRYVVPYDSASVQQIEENRLVIIGGHGFPNLEELLGESFDLTAQDNPNCEVVRTKTSLILDDAPAYFEGFRREPHAQAGIRAWLGVPLLFGDRLIGMIALDKREPGFYTEEHARLALAFAAQAAIAIENARLFHETQRRNRELTLLNRVIATTASAGEGIEPILEAVCRELALAFEVPQAAAALFNEEKTEAVVVAEYLAPGRPPSLGERIPVAANPASQHLLTRKTPLVIDDAQTDPRQAPIHDLLRRRGTVSLLLLPLMVDGEVVGSLGVDAVEPRVFSAQEVNLAWRVAEQVSGVLAQARLREERWQLEEQFHQAQKMEAVGRLAGGIAHDFNNLLTVIQLSTRLLERKLHPEDPFWPHVEHIQDAGQRAADLTKRLLAFSRREIVEPQVLDLNQVLGELDKMLRRLIGEDVELTLLPAGELWPVKVDPTQVEQVVINLAVNARDAMLGGGKLTIETANVVLDEAYTALHLEVEPGQYVMLAVSDNGVGMSDEVKAHLFEPFFTTKGKGKGSGLGLATVFGIVKQNRGHIGVYSEVGQGTTFKIYLPRFAADAHAPSHRPTAYAEPSARGSETVLVAEDEAPVRELMRTILTAQGYRVLTAEDGVEALQVAQRHEGPIHLLLTDVVMPRMSGKVLADRLRPSRPGMRVLYTSGYTNNAIAHHGVLDEGTHLLSKPFDLETLIGRVRDMLDGRV